VFPWYSQRKARFGGSNHSQNMQLLPTFKKVGFMIQRRSTIPPIPNYFGIVNYYKCISNICKLQLLDAVGWSGRKNVRPVKAIL